MSAQSFQELLARKRRNTLPDHAMHAAVGATLRDRYAVDDFYFGAKQTGKSVSRSLSVVCLVNKKLSKRQLNSQQLTCLPKTIGCKINGNGNGNGNGSCKRFKTDVQEIGDKFTQAAANMNPGDLVKGSVGRAYGTIGLFGRHPDFGVVCTTAGHTARDILGAGNSAGDLILYDRERRATVAGTVKRKKAQGQVDYAIVRPRQQSDTERVNLTDHNIVEPYLRPRRSDVSRPLWLIARGKAVSTRFLGIKVDPFTFASRRYANVILTRPIGRKGDSGAALVDDQYRIWGTLIGSRRGAFSMFMRISTLLENEHFIFGLGES